MDSQTECAHFWTTDGFLGSQERKLPPLLESESAVSRSQLLAAVGLIALGVAAAWPFRRNADKNSLAVRATAQPIPTPVTLEVSPLAATSPAEESETQFRLLRSRVERPRPPQPKPAELETLPAPPTFPASFRSELEPVLPNLREPRDLPAWKPHDSPKKPARKSRGRRHRVIDGDNLAALAKEYLGDEKRAWKIYEFNRDLLAAPDILPLGVMLRIPDDDASPDDWVSDTAARPEP